MTITNKTDTPVGYITVAPPRWMVIHRWVMSGMLKDAELLKTPCEVLDKLNEAHQRGSEKITITFNPDGTMNIDDNLPYIPKVGDRVNVCRMGGDEFSHDFTGTIIGNSYGYWVVEDMDGEAWDCDPEQLTLDTNV